MLNGVKHLSPTKQRDSSLPETPLRVTKLVLEIL